MRRIVVQWGDGSTSTLRNKPGVETAIGQQNQLPPGTYKLTHAYAAPDDRKPFTHVVIIRTEDASGGVDFCITQITLTPRYRVTHYRIRLNLESECDSPFEAMTEFDVRLFLDQALVNSWKWEEPQSVMPGTPFVLEGSAISRELTVTDGNAYASLEITEDDPLFDDYLPSVGMILSALDESMSVSQVMEGDGCKVRYSYDKEVTLIAPIPPLGQSVVMTANP